MSAVKTLHITDKIGTARSVSSTLELTVEPRVQETLLCHPAPSLRGPRRGQPRGWPRCGVCGTATCAPAPSCCGARLDVPRQAWPRSCSARASACAARHAPVGRAPSRGSTTTMGHWVRRCAAPWCSPQGGARGSPGSRRPRGRMDGAARAGAVPRWPGRGRPRGGSPSPPTPCGAGSMRSTRGEAPRTDGHRRRSPSRRACGPHSGDFCAAQAL